MPKPGFAITCVYHACIRIDNAMLGCENAVEFYRTSAVEYMLAVRRQLPNHRNYG